MEPEEGWSPEGGVERQSASEEDTHVEQVRGRRSPPRQLIGWFLIQLCSAQEEEPQLSAGEEAELSENVGGMNMDAVLVSVPSMPSATVITPTPPEAESGAEPGEGLCRF